jgi:hypothetical protein
MKTPVAAGLLLAITLTACGHTDLAADAGNPNHMAYAGAPGSVYDAGANPPQNIGQVAYNPYQPLESNLPSGQRLPAATAEPLPPVMPASR